MRTRFRLVCFFALLACACIAHGCNHGRPCLHAISGVAEGFGPTDVSAASGNMRLSIAINPEGALTVFKWPNPSFYDQVKFMTEARDKPRLGALANEGAFAGVYWETGEGEGFSWLRDETFSATQFYNSDDSDCAVTRFESKSLGLTVVQLDLVLADKDALVRHYHVRRSEDSPVVSARLMHLANFHPVVTKYARAPLRDWCLECMGDSHLEYEHGFDALVYFEKGRDLSTGKRSSVAIAIGTRSLSSGHQAGMDSIAARLRPLPRDPFKQAPTGTLPGSDRARGEVTAGLMQEIVFNDQDSFQDSLIIAAAGDRDAALQTLASARAEPFSEQLMKKREFWWSFLADAPMPDTHDQRVIQVAKRSIVSVLQAMAPGGGIMASIDTQGPYGEDWPRDGAFINVALETANLSGLVKRHNLFYARVQSRSGQKMWLVPEGNWAAVYYADGKHGMPIPYEIDETGLCLWTLCDHFQRSGDREYLKRVYPAIEAAADFLVEFRDPETGLHRKSWEDDNPFKRRSVHGAVPIYAGLREAAEAARALGRDDQAARWQARADEVHRAIMEHLLHPECNCFAPSTGPHWDDAWAIYPGELFPYEHAVMQGCADSLWKKLEHSFGRKQGRSFYEPKALLSLALVWKNDPEKMEKVQEGVRWQARAPITDTGHFGEAWKIEQGRVTPLEDMPHVWHHALFYAAAVEAFGARPAERDPGSYYRGL